MIEVVALPPWWAKEAGERLKKMIARACSHAVNTSPEQLIEAVERNEAVLWLMAGDGAGAVCFTRCVELADGRRAIEITSFGGHGIRQIAPVFRNRLHEYRRAEGAECLLAVGRKGWGRMFHVKPVGMSTAGQFIFEDEG